MDTPHEFKVPAEAGHSTTGAARDRRIALEREYDRLVAIVADLIDGPDPRHSLAVPSSAARRERCPHHSFAAPQSRPSNGSDNPATRSPHR